MKKFVSRIFLLTLAVVFLAPANQPAKISVAIYPITVRGGDKSLGPVMTGLLVYELSQSDRIQVIEEEAIRLVMERQGLNESDLCSSTTCQVEIGKLVKAQKMVIGDLMKMGSKYVITLRVIDIQSGVVEKSAKEECNCTEDQLDQLAATAGRGIRSFLGESGSLTLPPSASSVAQNASGPAKKIIGKCPADMVYISERNFCIDIYEYSNKKDATPTSSVSFIEAKKLCEKVSKRLPTEEEWETACLGPNKDLYGYGMEYSKNRCNTKQDSYSRLLPSGYLQECKNYYNIFDMVGNLWEWTQGDSVRGGGWMWGNEKMMNCMGRWRDTYNRDRISGYTGMYGFRCTKDAE